MRVTFGLALCAACYEAGRWHGALEAQAERTPQRALASAPAPKAGPVVEAVPGAAAPGQAVGAAQDVITPLNVRDPSALVMAPFATEPPPAAPAAPRAAEESDEAPPSPPARIFPRPSAKVKPTTRF